MDGRTGGLSTRVTTWVIAVGLAVAPMTACSASDSSATSANAATSTTPNTTVAEVAYDGDPSSPWCQNVPAVGAAALAVNQLDPDSANPDEVRDTVATLIETLNVAVPVAPTEIDLAVKQFADDVEAFDELLGNADYDLGAANRSALAAVNDRLAANAANIDAYNRQVCS